MQVGSSDAIAAQQQTGGGNAAAVRSERASEGLIAKLAALLVLGVYRWRICPSSCSLGSRARRRLQPAHRLRHWMLRSPSWSCLRALLQRPQRQSR